VKVKAPWPFSTDSQSGPFFYTRNNLPLGGREKSTVTKMGKNAEVHEAAIAGDMAKLAEIVNRDPSAINAKGSMEVKSLKCVYMLLLTSSH